MDAEENFEGPVPLPKGNDPLGGVGPFGAPGWGLRALGLSGTDPFATALALIRNPEGVAEHLAATGAQPPGDIPEGTTHEEAGRALMGPQSEAATREPEYATPSQQGAAEGVPLPRERPTPSPESPNSGGAVPAKSKTKSGGDSIDDLGKALAGLKSMNTARPLEIGTPAAPHPSNAISRATLPSVLLQQLSGITKGTTGPYRLGQALGGIRNA